MIIFLKYLLSAIFVLSIQGVFFKGIKPDLVLILVFYYSLKFGSVKGMTYGAATGLIIDSASGIIFGPNMISKMFIGYAIASIRQRLFQWNFFASTLLIAIFSLLDILLIQVCYEIFAGISFINRPMDIPLTQTVYTMGFGLLAYPFLNPEEETRTLI